MKNFKPIVDKYGDELYRVYMQNKELSISKVGTKFKSENPSCNYGVDYVRKAISYVVKNKQKEKNETIAFSFDKRTFNDITIVRSYYKEPETFVIPKYNSKILVINDVHVPYHDENALYTALDYGRKQNINTIILNGDIADFYALSAYDRNPNQRDFHFELELVRQFLQALRKAFPQIDIYYKMGNHEDRFERYLVNKAPELFNVEEIQLQQLLKLYELDIKYIPASSIIKINQLSLLHGHEIRSGGVNIARSNILKAFTNVAAAHNHRSQEFIQPRLSDSVIGSYTIGCLCGLKPLYMPINQWNHGFAIIEQDEKGFEFHNYKIINGVVK